MTHTKDEALQMCLEYIETDAHERKYVRHAIKQALAAQPAPVQEPVGYVAENGVVDWNVCAPPILTDLYTTPPAPAVPDAMTSADIQEHIEYVAGWNECRQAMLEMTKNRSN